MPDNPPTATPPNTPTTAPAAGAPIDIETIATEVAKKAARENPGVSFQPATIIAIAADASTQYVTCTVLIDGDDPSNSTEAVSLIGTVAVGQRTMVLFVPPHGVYVIGVFGAKKNDCTPFVWVECRKSNLTAGDTDPADTAIDSVNTWQNCDPSTFGFVSRTGTPIVNPGNQVARIQVLKDDWYEVGMTASWGSDLIQFTDAFFSSGVPGTRCTDVSFFGNVDGAGDVLATTSNTVEYFTAGTVFYVLSSWFTSGATTVSPILVRLWVRPATCNCAAPIVPGGS